MKNLCKKLVEIQKVVNGLGKDKKNNNYEYVSGNKVLGVVKPMMNELGLLLVPSVTSIENTRQDYVTRNGNKSEILSKVLMTFTWIDSDSGESMEVLWGANGQNDWEKGLGSALTYAERYFIMKFFHIPTDEDDIDNPDRRTTPPVPEPESPPKKEFKLSWFDNSKAMQMIFDRLDNEPDGDVSAILKEEFLISDFAINKVKEKYDEYRSNPIAQ